MNPLLLVLSVLGGILGLILLLILLGSVKIRIAYRDKARVVLYVCGIPITLVSDKPKKKDLPKELKPCTDPNTLLRRERKKYLKAKKKAEKKAAKKLEKKKKKEAEKEKRKRQHQQGAKKKKDPKKPTLFENLAMILALLKALYGATNGKFRLRVYRMHLLVGSEDAAKTAILYGSAVQGLAYILQWLQDHFIPIRRDEGAMTVNADFVRCKTSVEVDLCCSLKIRRAIVIGVKMLMAYLKEKQILDQKIKQRLEEAKRELEAQSPNTTTTT